VVSAKGLVAISAIPLGRKQRGVPEPVPYVVHGMARFGAEHPPGDAVTDRMERSRPSGCRARL